MTETYLTTPTPRRASIRRAQSEHHLAVRVLTKAGRVSFTDAINQLNEYVDPAGDRSSSTKIDKKTGKTVKAAFIHFTRQLYRCFGLTETQAEAKLAGESLRDILNEIVLMAIYQAEIEAALWITSRIDAKELRKVIKAGMKTIFEKHADQCAVLQAMARVAA